MTALRRIVLSVMAASLGLVLLIGTAPAEGLRHDAIGPSPDAFHPEPPGAVASGVENEAEEIAERADWFYSRRAFPHLWVPRGAYLSSVIEAGRADGIDQKGRSSSVAEDRSVRWRALGPRPIADSEGSRWTARFGPVAGRVTSLALHPRDPRIAYAGAATGGVWKTTDDGRTWTPLFDDQPALAIGAVGIDPKDPDTVYAATGEGNFSGDSYFGVGIFKSTDAGKTWRLLPGRFNGCHFTRLVVTTEAILATTHPVGAYAAESAMRGCTGGVWRSDDGGKEWEPVIASRYGWDLAVSASDPSIVYAATEPRGVFRSKDGGKNWELLRGLPPAGFGRTVVAVSPTDPNRVYVGMMKMFYGAGGGDLLGIFSSSDGGTTWRALPPEQNFCGYLWDPTYGQCWYDFVLAVDPTDPATLYAGGIRLFKYQEGDRFLTQIAPNMHVDQHALEFDRRGRLWVGNDGGVYRTSDGGESFQSLNDDLEITQFYPGISGSLDRHIVAGTQDNGTLRYDGKPRWLDILGADGGYSAVDNRSKMMIATMQWLRIWRSYDRGASWRLSENGIGDEPRGFIAPLVGHPRQGEVLYAGTTMVYRSTNAAGRWDPMGIPLDGSNVTAIGPAPSDIDAVYAGTDFGGVFVTFDGGTTWTRSGEDLPTRVPTDFYVDPRDPKTAFVVFSGFHSGHVFKTSDGGQTWRDLSANLPDTPANAVIVDERTEKLYVGTDIGVFSLERGEKKWELASRDLPTTVVMDLLIDYEASAIVAATHGRSMWAADL